MRNNLARFGVIVLLAGAIASCGTPAAEPAGPPPPAEESEPAPPEAPPELRPEEPPTEEPAPEEPAEVPDRAELRIVNFSYQPRIVTIQIGGTVAWRHEDSAPHTVTSDDGVFDSGTLQEGGSFQFTFDSPGTYTYFCEIHPSITGVIEVVEAGQAAVDSSSDTSAGDDYYYSD